MTQKTISTTIKTAAIYARFSSHAQREESIEQQVEECQQYAAQNGYEIVEVYADKAVTGTKETRAAYQRLLYDAERKKFGAIIAYKSSRIARNMLHGLQLEAKLELFGVNLLYVKEEFGDNAAGRFALRSMMNVNQFYSENLAEDIMRGMDDNAKNGKRNGGVTPFGYQKSADGRFEIDPENSLIVKEIYEKVRDGVPQSEILEDLNARGIRTQLGREWVRTSFSKLLTNERYLGTYSWNGIKVEGGMPRILDNNLFYAVQDVLTSKPNARGRSSAIEEYILTGRIFCGHCGERMIGVSGTSRHGTKYFYYDCVGRRQKLCTKSMVRKDWIEERVIEIINDFVLCDETVQWLADQCMIYQSNTVEQQRLKTSREAFASAEAGISNIIKAIEQGISTTSVVTRLRELEAEKSALAKEIEFLSAQNPQFTREQVVSYFESFRRGDSTAARFRRQLTRYFIGAVFVYDDEIRIAFNYSKTKDAQSFKIAREVRASDAPVHQTTRRGLEPNGSSPFSCQMGRPHEIYIIRKGGDQHDTFHKNQFCSGVYSTITIGGNMKKQPFQIGSIPAIFWGEPSDQLILAVHGNMSSKTDVPIEILAEEAGARGFQTLSFDLPEHGERKNTPERCNPQTCQLDLNAVLAYAKPSYKEISLFACSMGAYFSLLTFADEAFQRCLFLSPVVDMLHIIQNMMRWAQVSEEKLEQEREIPTAFGPTLYWDYYQTVKENPITRWKHPTSILYGDKDELCAREDVLSFAEQFQCNLQIAKNAEHYFHTEEELRVYRHWIKRCLSV